MNIYKDMHDEWKKKLIGLHIDEAKELIPHSKDVRWYTPHQFLSMELQPERMNVCVSTTNNRIISVWFG